MRGAARATFDATYLAFSVAAVLVVGGMFNLVTREWRPSI